jgi:hypothetical protein
MSFFEKNSENAFYSPKKVESKKLMVPSESAPQELSNEWSCQYFSIILNLLGNFCVPPLVTELAISPLKSQPFHCPPPAR